MTICSHCNNSMISVGDKICPPLGISASNMGICHRKLHILHDRVTGQYLGIQLTYQHALFLAESSHWVILRNIIINLPLTNTIYACFKICPMWIFPMKPPQHFLFRALLEHVLSLQYVTCYTSFERYELAELHPGNVIQTVVMTLVMQVINAESRNLIVNLQLRLPNLHLLWPLSLKINYPYKKYFFLKSIWQVIVKNISFSFWVLIILW